MSLARRIGARRGALAAIALAAVVAGCEGTLITSSIPHISQVIASVATPGGGIGALRPDAVPLNASGQTFSVSSPPAAVVGGTALYTLTSSQPFQQALVAVDGYDGYFEVNLPAPVTSVDLLVTFQQEQLSFNYGMVFNGAPVGGTPQGAGAFAQTRLIAVGTGDVQVSVFFDSLADVDLHVVDPTGEEIYYGNRQGVNGTLDLDANAGCGIDNPVVNNENITFPTGQAPRGTYIVRLAYWSACRVLQTKYVVTVSVKGQTPQIFTGTFTGPGTGGGLGAGELITTFTY
jgi:hypothetical protein